MRRDTLAFALTTILAVGLAGSPAGQQRTPTTAAPATLDDVLDELRALRTELREELELLEQALTPVTPRQ